MDPDKAHEKYFKKNPNGNHIKPSPETLIHLDNMNKKMDAIVSEQKEHNKNDDRRFGSIEKGISDLKVHMVEIKGYSKKAMQESESTNGKIAEQEGRLRELEDVKILRDSEEKRIMSFIETSIKDRKRLFQLVQTTVITTVIGGVFTLAWWAVGSFIVPDSIQGINQEDVISLIQQAK